MLHIWDSGFGRQIGYFVSGFARPIQGSLARAAEIFQRRLGQYLFSRDENTARHGKAVARGLS